MNRLFEVSNENKLFKHSIEIWSEIKTNADVVVSLSVFQWRKGERVRLGVLFLLSQCFCVCMALKLSELFTHHFVFGVKWLMNSLSNWQKSVNAISHGKYVNFSPSIFTQCICIRWRSCYKSAIKWKCAFWNR